MRITWRTRCLALLACTAWAFTLSHSVAAAGMPEPVPADCRLEIDGECVVEADAPANDEHSVERGPVPGTITPPAEPDQLRVAKHSGANTDKHHHVWHEGEIKSVDTDAEYWDLAWDTYVEDRATADLPVYTKPQQSGATETDHVIEAYFRTLCKPGSDGPVPVGGCSS